MANMNYEDLCSKISNNIFKIGNNGKCSIVNDN